MPENNGIGPYVVVATRNQGKVKEFASLFMERGVQVKSLADFPDMPEIEETGSTFAENAMIKAQAVALRYRLPALADDSGLCVEPLGGDPGVYSARYAGAGARDEDNNAKLLRELGNIGAEPTVHEDGVRTLGNAKFVCALCLVDAEGERIAEVEEACEGAIMDAPRGTGGFGYDPLFYIPTLGRSMAELSVAEKNELSHRGRAIRSLWEKLGSLS